MDSQFDGGDSGNVKQTDGLWVCGCIDSGDLDLVLDECGKLFILWGEGNAISTPRRHADQTTISSEREKQEERRGRGEEISQSKDPGVSIVDLVDRIVGEGDDITRDFLLFCINGFLFSGEEEVFHLRDVFPGPVEEGTEFSRSRVSAEKLSILVAAPKREKERRTSRSRG